MNKMQKLLALLLGLVILSTSFTSCNKEDQQQNNINEDKYVYDDSCREKAADSIPDDYDLENQTITAWHHADDDFVKGNEETTDIIYSRIYERNLSVEERLNVNYEYYTCTAVTWPDSSDELKREIQTMSTGFDFVFAGNNRVIQQKLFNYFHNLNDSNYIDIYERWWYTDAIMEVSVDNYNYRFLYGDIYINNLSMAGSIFYNKELYEQYISPTKDRDDLYDKVFDGTWTLEEFDRLVKKGHISRGGDGTNDIWGLAMTYAEWNHYFRESAGIRMYERNDQGIPEFDFKDDNSVEFTEKLYALYFENSGTLNSLYKNQTNTTSFTDGTLIFEMGRLHNVLSETYRDMKDDFGILPYPKLNEDQDMYYTLIHNASIATCIPVSTDIDFANEEVSAVIEALASESYRNVSVSFYETALKTAYNRDDQSAQMIDIITGQHDTVKSSLTKNFAYEYTHSLSRVGTIFSDLMSQQSTNFASQYDSIVPSANIALRDLIQLYKDGTI